MFEETLEGVRPKKPGQPAGNVPAADYLTREQKFLLRSGESFDAETKRAIAEKEFQFFDADYYFRVLLLAGRTTVLDTNNRRAVGVTNLDENHLPNMVYMALSKLRVSWGTDNGTNPAAVDTFTNVGNTIPAALLNAELLIRVNDKPVVELPIAKFFNTAATASSHTIQGTVQDSYFLDAMRLIRPTDAITIEINCPPGIALPAGNHFVEVRLMGASTRRR